MLFNTREFAIFLVIVFTIYWLLKNLKHRNILLLVASYVFYGWWDYRFLSLIVISSLCDYYVGIFMSRSADEGRRKWLLAVSLIVNLGMLFFFKYYNFFIDSLLTPLGIDGQFSTLNIILPVGISFYTFQTLSYTIDIYRRKLEPTTDMVQFLAYVSFFPQLVAGPIERAKELLPQFKREQNFSLQESISGLRQILWGLFKKIVVADQCAHLVNEIFGNHQEYGALVLLLGAIFFAFQIYGDFSGYSDIAIGVARLFGYKLMTNFKYPYFSRDIAEFWRRWHISLSTWFRDYLYIPLGGSKVDSTFLLVRNIFIIFLVSGLWHGANWTFVIWGGLNAIYFLPSILLKRNRRNIEIIAYDGKIVFSEIVSVLITFFITCLAWVFFRAENLSHAFSYLAGLGNLKFSLMSLSWNVKVFFAIIYISILISIEWFNRTKAFPLEGSTLNKITRWSFYLFIGFMVIVFSGTNQDSFIYFQF